MLENQSKNDQTGKLILLYVVLNNTYQGNHPLTKFPWRIMGTWKHNPKSNGCLT